MRVLVVGAGMAGLTVAEQLLGAGVHVELVEGGPRAGGRARTVHDRFVGGQYAESGAEWIDTDHHRMLALMRRFGVETLGEGQAWTHIRRMLFHDGRLLDAETAMAMQPTLQDELDAYDEAFERIGVGIADPARPDLHPEAVFHDSRSMQTVADELGLSGLSALLALRNAQGEFAEEPAGVSSLFVGQQRAQMRECDVQGVSKAHRVRGGMAAIVGPLAAAVDAALPGTIAYDELLTAVSWGAGGVEARTTRRVIAADHIVLACSLVPLRAVAFDPPLPSTLARAIAELGYGTVTKTALQYPARTWPKGYASSTLASQRVYEPAIDQPGDEGILMAYTGGDGGRRLAEHDEAERMRIVAGDIDTMYQPPTAPLGGFSRAWSNEARFGGAYAAYRPGQVTAFWQALREPCGPVHLAGEHVATWTGYLEGAVESGERVATRLLTAP
jgi:monoamine oxidase